MEPVGIFASVRLTPNALDHFISDHGEALVDDVKYIFANNRTDFLDIEAVIAFGKTNPTHKQTQEFFAKLHAPKADILTPNGYFHNGGNQMLFRYEDKTQTLFCLYVLELRHPDHMEEVPSYNVLKKIVAYKDIDCDDYAVFSSSMPNLPTRDVWRAYLIQPGSWTRADESALPDSVIPELWRLSKKYYFAKRKPKFPESHFIKPLAEIVSKDLASLPT